MSFTAALQSLSGPPAYAAVGLLAMLESAAFVGLVVPGETAMLFGGALAAAGYVSLSPDQGFPTPGGRWSRSNQDRVIARCRTVGRSSR